MTIIQEPPNSGNPPARQTPGIEPPTTVQTKPTDQIGNRVQIPNLVRTMPPDSGPSTTTTAQEPQNTNNRPALGKQSTEAPVIRRPVPTDQIGDRVLISRSVQTTPSSTKPPIHYNNNTKTAEYQQPTSAADISHRATNHVTARARDQIENRTPIPDPVRATRPDSRPSTRPIPPKPQNTKTPPAHSTAAAIPTTTTQPKSVSQIANHTPIPNPVHDHAARHRITCNGSTMKPRNTNNLPARQTSAA